MHGGAIEARSEGPDKGSEFIVRLPAAQAKPENPVSPVNSRRRNTACGLEVLLIDDNVDAAETLGSVLELWGHCVHIAHDGAKGIETALRVHPDAVLLDIGMPGMDGYTVAARLRSDPATAGVLLVAVSGYGQPQDRARSTEAGFDDHLTKPVHLPDLQRLLDARTSKPAEASVNGVRSE